MFVYDLLFIWSFSCKEIYYICIIIEHSPICYIVRNGWSKYYSIENLSGLKSSDGISLDATLASKSAFAFWNLGIEEMLKAEKKSPSTQ